MRESKKTSFNFGYLLTFLLLLVLAAWAVLLLFPTFREYRNRKREQAEKERELESLRAERVERVRDNNELSTSPAAVEKVGREKYNLVKDGEIVVKYEPEK